MSENAQRVGILIIAIIFLVTTIGLAFYAVLFNDDTSTQLSQQELEEAINNQNQQQEAPVTSSLDNFTPVENVTELNFEDQVVGTGKEVTSDLSIPITFHYTGVLAVNNQGFDSSVDRGEPITYALQDLIVGWQQGIPGMKEGGKRRLFIPSELAYGEMARPGIPANSDLVFDIEVIKVGE
jgi:FKBP-type peptidyl-prolyl cis-trans isomerase